MVTEHKEQALFFAWCMRHASEFRGLDSIYAIPNGGNRDAITGAMLKKEGVRKGIPDMCLPVPIGGKGALYLELKVRSGGKVGPEQKEWQKRLLELGNESVIVKGFKEARLAVMKYYENH